MTEHRPPIVSLIDYGRRTEVPSGTDVKRLTAPRVADYRARHQDRAYRTQHGLGLEPRSRESGDVARHAGARVVPCSALPAPALRSGRRGRSLRIALLCAGGAALVELLPNEWAAILLLSLVAVLFIVGALVAIDYPEEVARLTEGWRD